MRWAKIIDSLMICLHGTRTNQPTYTHLKTEREGERYFTHRKTAWLQLWLFVRIWSEEQRNIYVASMAFFYSKKMMSELNILNWIKLNWFIISISFKLETHSITLQIWWIVRTYPFIGFPIIQNKTWYNTKYMYK